MDVLDTAVSAAVLLPPYHHSKAEAARPSSNSDSDISSLPLSTLSLDDLDSCSAESSSSSSPSLSSPSTSASASCSLSSSVVGSPLLHPDSEIERALSIDAECFCLQRKYKSRSRSSHLHDKKKRTKASYAAELVRREAKALLDLASRLDEEEGDAEEVASSTPSPAHSFEQALHVLGSMHRHGKIVLTGVGKSGLLARKAVATFNSLGFQSVFLHPVEAVHGDMGLVSPHGVDVVIPVSYSGKTAELLALVALLRTNKRSRSVVISVTKPGSPLAAVSDLCLDGSIEDDAEADDAVPAPTSSVLVALALLDSLALSSLRLKTGWDNGDGQSRRDVFALNHPGGNLGQLLAVSPL